MCIPPFASSQSPFPLWWGWAAFLSVGPGKRPSDRLGQQMLLMRPGDMVIHHSSTSRTCLGNVLEEQKAL